MHAEQPEIIVPATTPRCVRSGSSCTERDDFAPLMVRTVPGAAGDRSGGDARRVGARARRRGVRDRVRGRPTAEAHRRARAAHATSSASGDAVCPASPATRDLLDELDPVHPARSTLEVKTRRLLVANGITGVRRASSRSSGTAACTAFDFACPAQPARSSRRTAAAGTTTRPTTSTTTRSGASPDGTATALVFATWEKVTRDPGAVASPSSPRRARREQSVGEGGGFAGVGELAGELDAEDGGAERGGADEAAAQRDAAAR